MSSIGALGLIMLFQYQNCAPATGAKSLSVNNDNGLVTTIDDVNSAAAVQFPQEKVQVASSDQPTLIDGECALQEGQAVLGWKATDGSGNTVETGYSVCDQGKFQVEMAPSNEMDCGASYTVKAQLGQGQAGEVQVSRDCSSGGVAVN